jgi:hypothetical protein
MPAGVAKRTAGEIVGSVKAGLSLPPEKGAEWNDLGPAEN